MHLEWFDRVCEELQESLNSICEKYDENGRMSIERGAKHPRLDFFTYSGEEDIDYFCTLFFDPYNEEFYIQTIDPEYGLTSKVVLEDIDDIMDAVHESFHEYIEADFIETEDSGYIMDDEEETDEIYFEEIDVEWETPEVTAYYDEDEVEISYQFGVVGETGDGVLKRTNRIWTKDDDLIKDESHFIFSKDEASTIIAMIASHMDSLAPLEEGEV
ncbi:hypothetical protein BN988_01407 [Oceanobacillus picturae]|uniref:Uncharacterized protein n=1 Tax=Oceanobacillus picturae TaxID=171693 RepID=W9AJS6_9BACI|nr:hypothetical protein [Oceanobacillus picturae]CDO02926.1 hypothetical protein BN988_01407 [Oceanobacillus picturae]